MKDDIKAKLRKVLTRPISSEEQVVYIMVELRKLMEINGDADNFPSLLFHCDWVAHPVMDRKAAKHIVSLFDKHQEGIDMTVRAPGGKASPDMKYFAELGPIMTLSNFRHELGRVHTNRRASTMNAKQRNARKTTSSFSKREKMRRKPFSLLKSRSISLRFLYRARSYSQGCSRLDLGGTTGIMPRSSTSWRVSLPS